MYRDMFGRGTVHYDNITSVRHARDGINARKIAILRMMFLSFCVLKDSPKTKD